MRQRHVLIIYKKKKKKKRFLRVLCRAFVSGLAGNGEMSASRLTGNFTECECATSGLSISREVF